jgi:hydrophobe/amphiphile efflux-1 (HAE1) family protein
MRRLNISAWSIRTPMPSVVLFIILIILGVTSFRALPIERFPNIDFPLVAVTITQAGASPSELETQVTKRVENAVASITGVKHIGSSITDGVSTTSVEFQIGTSTDRALNDVKDAVARIRADLPSTIDEPISRRIDIVGLPILTYAASAPDMTVEELSWFIDDTIARELQSVRGVAEIRRVGGVNREVRVSLDPNRLLALGITAGDVSLQLRATNMDIAGGKSEIGGSEQTIRALAGAMTIEHLAATPISLPGGRKVRLDELGTIRDGGEEAKFFTTLNGQEVVGFQISRASGASDVVVAKLVAEKVAEVSKSHPKVKLELVDSSVVYTYGNYLSTMHTLLEGALLAVFVVFLFLRNWRATLMAAIALPLSIFPTFWVISALGFSLNLLTLLALTLVTGILVDDAIVEIENIVRHMRMGKSAYRAALEAADEIGLAVIAITTTIVAVFVPTSLMGGIAGMYFRQFGVTVAVAVVFSLLVARLVTPMLSAYFQREHGEENEKENALLQLYTRVIAYSVHHRLKTVGVGLLIFGVSIWGAFMLPAGFMPPDDTSRILIAAELPPGARLDDMRVMTDKVAAIIRERPDVRNVFVDGGRILGFMGGGQEVRKATFVVNLLEKGQRKLSQRQIEQELTHELSQIPDLRSWVMNENGERGLSLIVTGSDSEAVTLAAPQVVSAMREMPMLRNVVSSSSLDRQEMRFRPRSEIAAELGVSTEALSQAIRIATIGDVSANLPKFNAGDRQIPIRVQLDESARSDRQILETLKIRTKSGATVPLITVASIENGQGPSSIDRRDRQRHVVIGADLANGVALGDALGAVLQLKVVESQPKEGANKVSLKQIGDAEVMGEIFASFGYAIGAGLMMVYALLVLLFGSFLQPITILFSLPLSIGGVIFALLITREPFSFPVVIGVLMLMGVVTKNAILLVDFAVEEIARGVSRFDAIIDAGRKRARPIVMTSIAMIGGMLPSALALGSGGEFRAPMAIAVIGGLAASTALSLIFVPAVFILMDDVGTWIWGVFSQFVGPTDEPETAPHEILLLEHANKPETQRHAAE